MSDNITQLKPNNLRKPQAVVWNDGALLDACGNNIRRIAYTLEKCGVSPRPTANAMYKWISQREIPDRWRPAMVYALLKDGKVATNHLFKRGKAEPNGK